jgi:hypothetical protein
MLGSGPIEDFLVTGPMEAVLTDVDRVMPGCAQARSEGGG